jgi:hypothetical protein
LFHRLFKYLFFSTCLPVIIYTFALAMSKTFNLYCDESCHLEHDGKSFLILSYVSSAYNQLDIHNQAIKELKKKHSFFAEIKWNKVSKSKFAFYSDLVDYFFATDLEFRAIVVFDKKNGPALTRKNSFDDFYYSVYHRLLYHKRNMDYNYNVYIDIKDTRSAEKIKRLKDMLNIDLGCFRNLQNIRSKESNLLQLSDLLMGALSYHISDQKKVRAKGRLIEKIVSHATVLGPSVSNDQNKLKHTFIELK